jgi:MYXO-CTERM domain-containing protein
MWMRLNSTLICGAAGAALIATTASAQVFLSFDFIDLDGTYDPGTQQFTANATAGGGLDTSGLVSRIQSPGGTAEFDAGFLAGVTQADARFSMTLSNITANSADGAGTFTITDHNGETLTGNLSGEWSTPGAGAIIFNGLLDSVTLSATQDFVGPSSGQFPVAGLPAQPWNGAVVHLAITPGGFFTSAFSGVSTQASGVLVPTPGTAALLALGGLVAMRRRR